MVGAGTRSSQGEKRLSPRWRPFAKARRFLRSLWLLSFYDWVAYVHGHLARVKGELPRDIPATPHYVYRGQGWKGYADWLGTDRKEPAEPRYLPFVNARHFAWRLSLESRAQWVAYRRGEIERPGPIPENVPADPSRVYAYTWRGWADWLGTLDGAPPGSAYRNFSEARAFAQSLGLRTKDQWDRFARGAMPELGELPEDVPAHPARVYHAFGFRGYGDWLGTGHVTGHQRPMLPFEQARAFVRKLGLASREEWNLWVRGELPGLPERPWTIPSDPIAHYAGRGFTSFGDFLGTGNIAPQLREWRDYESAREFARSLGLSSWREWSSYLKGDRPDLPPLPDDIPSAPWRAYGKEFTGSGDFLGTGRVSPGHCRDFAEAREFARSLGLSTVSEWRAYAREGRPGLPPLPPDIPSWPELVYRDRGWSGYPDWLGTKMRPFPEARRFARMLRLSSSNEWLEWAHHGKPGRRPRPRDIPIAPNQYYKGEGWASWGDFLGTGRVSFKLRTFVPYFEAVVFARKMGFRSSVEWRAWCRGDLPEKGSRPPDIPGDPAQAYRGRGWHGWKAFLGTKRRRR